MKPIKSIIVCIAKNRGIGKDNRLLFEIPEDLKRFKKITFGHPIIMGLNTYNSIGRPLPGRLNIVLTPDDIQIEGCTVCHDIESAIKKASEEDYDEIFFIGGGMVYKQAIEFADRLYLTVVNTAPEADTFFPEYSTFNKVISEKHGEHEGMNFQFLVLEK